MSIRRDQFFDIVRPDLFGGRLTQGQVDGLSILLNESEERSFELRWVAYVLATAFHETARTMQPIREYGFGAGRDYGRPDPVTGKTYYGRGYVQLTHRVNYLRMSGVAQADLLNQPDLALDPRIASKIIHVGMEQGMFTGRKLGDYITGQMCDFFNARRIINGIDRASMIAGYAQHFLDACKAASAKPPVATA